ncbi:hypothetical protein V7O61_07245 [Methanolobus sp. WCC1]|uniref:hypothetical protein n=1 Tax=unclassified Methanolobus TaxID=2629569 RepID=UPI003249A143
MLKRALKIKNTSNFSASYVSIDIELLYPLPNNQIQVIYTWIKRKIDLSLYKKKQNFFSTWICEIIEPDSEIIVDYNDELLSLLPLKGIKTDEKNIVYYATDELIFQIIVKLAYSQENEIKVRKTEYKQFLFSLNSSEFVLIADSSTPAKKQF